MHHHYRCLWVAQSYLSPHAVMVWHQHWLHCIPREIFGCWGSPWSQGTGELQQLQWQYQYLAQDQVDPCRQIRSDNWIHLNLPWAQSTHSCSTSPGSALLCPVQLCPHPPPIVFYSLHIAVAPPASTGRLLPSCCMLAPWASAKCITHIPPALCFIRIGPLIIYTIVGIQIWFSLKKLSSLQWNSCGWVALFV